jgi:hypothetical protein
MGQFYPQFDDEKIEFIFTYHAPNKADAETYSKINEAFIELGKKVIPLLPDGPGKTAAVRKLSDSRMACNASVALKGEF